MLKLCIVADKNEPVTKLGTDLAQREFTCSVVSPHGEDAFAQVTGQAPDLVLVAMDGSSAGSGIWHLPQKIRNEGHVPVIALLSKKALGNLDASLSIDDFVVEPWDAAEVAARAKLVLWRTRNIDSRELLKCGDLVIDLSRCEVSVNGRLVSLTFKEYELLKFLAGNKGKVFTREALLNKVWGYDYYGGDRTVDVHIRRLRSKIENSTHTFIETVINMGYRFKDDL